VCGNFYRDGAELGITRIPAGRAAPDAGTSPSTGTEDFKQTIGGNIADLARVGKGGSALPTRTPDSTRRVAHRHDDHSIESVDREPDVCTEK
jgi:hypothetical protein